MRARFNRVCCLRDPARQGGFRFLLITFLALSLRATFMTMSPFHRMERILVADVSGHGASAAMLTGIVKSAFHSASSDNYEPASVVERVANGIRAFGHHHFITLICARVRNGSLDFVNAGHPPGIL